MAIRKVLNQHPELSPDGYDKLNHPGLPTPGSSRLRQESRDHFLSQDGLSEINTACEYILSHDIPDWWTSYTLKHAAERWGQRNGYSGFVSNGAAIVAAILCGFTILLQEDFPNCTFPEKDDDLFHRERKRVG